MVTKGVKSQGFHFFEKEYQYVDATAQFDFFFFCLNSVWYKNALNTLGVI